MDIAYDDMLRTARRSADLSQRQLAVLAGVARSTVARLETRRVQPTVGQLARLLKAAGCELALVRSGDGDRPARVHDGGLRDRGRRRYPAHLDVRVPSAWRERLWPPQPLHGGARYRTNRVIRDRQRCSGYVDPRVNPTPDELYGLPPRHYGVPPDRRRE